jgi:hypothetical protein
MLSTNPLTCEHCRAQPAGELAPAGLTELLLKAHGFRIELLDALCGPGSSRAS